MQAAVDASRTSGEDAEPDTEPIPRITADKTSKPDNAAGQESWAASIAANGSKASRRGAQQESDGTEKAGRRGRSGRPGRAADAADAAAPPTRTVPATGPAVPDDGPAATESAAGTTAVQAPAARPPVPADTAGERTGHAGPRDRKHHQQPAGRRGRNLRVVSAAGAAILVVAAGGVALILQHHQVPRPTSPLTAQQRQALANRTSAASWIMKQVDPGTAVSCDQQMCADLATAGYQAADLHVLGPSTVPPLMAGLVVETPAVRHQFGSSMATAIAPEPVEIIGAGQAAVIIRLVAPSGAAAFRRSLQSGRQARQQNEAGLAGGGQITASASAKAELNSGQPDMRLVLAITFIAATLPVRIISFGNQASGGSPDLPLRFADLATTDPAGHLKGNAYVAAILAALRSVPPEYRPLWTKVVRISKHLSAIRVDEGAPSPLGVPPATG